MPTVSVSAFGAKPQFFDAAGNPDLSYKLFMYAAGSTSTKQNSYTNSTGTVANTNPIILNALGQTPNELWWDNTLLYKVVLAPSTDTDPPTNPVWTIDNLQAMNSGGGSTTANEWILYTASAIGFVNTNTFTLVGNQTLTFHIGRRLQFTTTGGLVYGRITNSVFTSVTTVTVQMDGTQILDSSLSAVYYSILTNNVSALPERIGVTSGTNAYTATVGISAQVLYDEYKLSFGSVNDGTAIPTLNLDGLGVKSLLLQNGAVPGTGQINGEHKIRLTTAGYIILNPNPAIVTPIRQTIISAPVDTNGFTALGGVTGSTTVTTTAISSTAPLVTNAAAGSTVTGAFGDRIGFSSANLAWTGLSVNGVMQLSVDISASGVMTPVSSSLLTTYQQGGTFSIVNGQHTFNISVMNQTIGNGTTAVQSYRVAIGEVQVTAGVVASIIWYNLNGKFNGPYTNTIPTTTAVITQNHNLGISPRVMTVWLKCLSADGGYAVGDEVTGICQADVTNTVVFGITLLTSRDAITWPVANGGLRFTQKTGAVIFGPSGSAWAYRFVVDRGW